MTAVRTAIHAYHLVCTTCRAKANSPHLHWSHSGLVLYLWSQAQLIHRHRVGLVSSFTCRLTLQDAFTGGHVTNVLCVLYGMPL